MLCGSCLMPKSQLSAKDGVMLQDGTMSRVDLPSAVEGPSVWYGPQMAKRTDWVHVLSAADVAEISAAMRPLVDRAADIARIGKAEFPLPTVAPKLAAICREVIDGRGFALLRGLPVERWSIREAATAYFGIGAHFGSARSQNAKGHVLGHVRNLGRNAQKDPTARVYQTNDHQTYHTASSPVSVLLSPHPPKPPDT